MEILELIELILNRVYHPFFFADILFIFNPNRGLSPSLEK